MREPVFTETLQISLVVRDLDAAMRTYVHEYGIGPWDVYEFNSDTVRDMQEDGQPVERAWRLALSQVGSVQLELIQPLDEHSIYARFLSEKGEGVHHVGVAACPARAPGAVQAALRRDRQRGFPQQRHAELRGPLRHVL